MQQGDQKHTAFGGTVYDHAPLRPMIDRILCICDLVRRERVGSSIECIVGQTERQRRGTFYRTRHVIVPA